MNTIQPVRRFVSATAALKISGAMPEIKIQVDLDAIQDANSPPVPKMKATRTVTSRRSNSLEYEEARASSIAMKRFASFGHHMPNPARSQPYLTDREGVNVVTPVITSLIQHVSSHDF